MLKEGQCLEAAGCNSNISLFSSNVLLNWDGFPLLSYIHASLACCGRGPDSSKAPGFVFGNCKFQKEESLENQKVD